MNRKEIKAFAKSKLHVHYWKSVFMMLIVYIFSLVGIFPTALGSVDSLLEFRMKFPAYKLTDPEVTLVLIVVIVCTLLLALVITVFLGVFLQNPIDIGSRKYFVNVNSANEANVADVCYPFDHHYLNNVKAMFVKKLRIMLYALLLVVPGIIKYYQYRFVDYILGEDSGIPYKDALAQSKKMMEGKIYEALLLDLSFIPLEILNLFTFGLLSIFYIRPYRSLANAKFYLTIKEKGE